MKYYQELTLLPDPDINMYFIWQKLYTQLHIRLVDVKNKHGIDRIGVSFPNYRYENKDGKEFGTLGNKLRVFGSESDLQILDLIKPLSRLTDYVHIKSILEVGDKSTKYIIVKRYRYTSMERQAQKFALHRGIDYDEALVHCQQYKANGRRNYPFINLVSSDTGQAFRLSIRQEIVKNEMIGSFSSYGLCGTTNVVTVPHW